MASLSFSAPKCVLLMARCLPVNSQASVPVGSICSAPVDAAGEGVQIFGAGDRRAGQLQQHAAGQCVIPAARGSQPQVALEAHPAAALACMARPQRRDLGGQQVGKAARDGGNEFKVGQCGSRLRREAGIRSGRSTWSSVR